jgi:hypothetical protein
MVYFLDPVKIYLRKPFTQMTDKGKLHKITQNHKRLCKSLPIPNLQYRGMVKSDPVINAHHQITPINY